MTRLSDILWSEPVISSASQSYQIHVLPPFRASPVSLIFAT
jgi:hypothetical protein